VALPPASTRGDPTSSASQVTLGGLIPVGATLSKEEVWDAATTVLLIASYYTSTLAVWQQAVSQASPRSTFFRRRCCDARGDSQIVSARGFCNE